MPTMGGTSLAVIDLASPDTAELSRKVREACTDSGFFYLINHDVGQDLLDEVFLQSKRFFDLPVEKKLQVLHSDKFRGYIPMSTETLDPDNSKQGDTNEAYYIGWDLPEDDPKCDRPFHGPNVWPPEDMLPGWRQTMEKYYTRAMTVGHKVASLIALALHMEEDFFRNKFTVPLTVFRLLHYFPVVSSPEEGRFGSGAHSDYGLLTLLATDHNPGLQICKDKSATPMVWENVAPMKGAFIVNLGDLLERWTNGLFRSTLHRVLLNGAERYSVPYFFEPDFDTLVECLPTCCSPSDPPKCQPITSGHHLLMKYQETFSTYDDIVNQVHKTE